MILPAAGLRRGVSDRAYGRLETLLVGDEQVNADTGRPERNRRELDSPSQATSHK